MTTCLSFTTLYKVSIYKNNSVNIQKLTAYRYVATSWHHKLYWCYTWSIALCERTRLLTTPSSPSPQVTHCRIQRCTSNTNRAKTQTGRKTGLSPPLHDRQQLGQVKVISRIVWNFLKHYLLNIPIFWFLTVVRFLSRQSE